jgi:hypothetical protein
MRETSKLIFYAIKGCLMAILQSKTIQTKPEGWNIGQRKSIIGFKTGSEGNIQKTFQG